MSLIENQVTKFYVLYDTFFDFNPRFYPNIPTYTVYSKKYILTKTGMIFTKSFFKLSSHGHDKLPLTIFHSTS